MIYPWEHSYPIEYQQQNLASGNTIPNEFEAKVSQYIMTWRQQCRSVFIQRRNIWDRCWKYFRLEEDYSAKQGWQSQIVLPKVFTSVKMAANTIKRLLLAAKKPWDVEAVNEDDLIQTLRAEQMTDLTKLFLDKAYFLPEFTEGLESAFITGIGVWKLWWGQVPRKQVRVETRMIQSPYNQPQAQQGQSLLGSVPSPREAPPPFAQPRFGYAQQAVSQFPTQMGGEFINPMGLPGGQAAPSAPPNVLEIPTVLHEKRVIEEEILEGRLFMKAVDPYNFYWLPGSKLNRWVGTLEDIEIPKWELIKMAEAGIFPMDKVMQVQPRRIDERYKMSNLRWTETVMTQNGPNADTAVVKLTEYYGPLVWDGKIIEEYAHVLLANDTTVLVLQRNPFYHRKPPYIAFSPLAIPFRTEGVGIVEPVLQLQKALSNLANMSVDTLQFRLMPLFEVATETLENQEDLETGMTPGKVFRKNLGHAGIEAIKPVEMMDISSGTTQVWSALDRSFQEGALVSDVAEGLPRNRGQQTATETQLLSQQTETFMGGMAADIEKQALEPIVSMAIDLIFQFIDTANDPRIASILGVGADILKGMSRAEILEMISGDYKVKVSGITGQLMKADMLQNLVQFMNLVGQNPQAWLPYINEDALLRRMLEAFRPHIHDLEDIIADPAIAEAKRAAMVQTENLPELMRLLPQLLQLQQGQQQQPQQLDPNQLLQSLGDMHQQNQDIGLQLQTQQHEREMAQMEQKSQAMQAQQQMQQAQVEHQQQLQQMAAQAGLQNAAKANQGQQG
ncbi:MAG: hypothetical protein KGI27_09880 [Thaumarchaeota archaeon]|nr:hypothetical protein [Nitrososphaerota archaeon]